MTEILTESFCERCGTRYTFESAAPRQKRLGGLKTLGRGFKNFVMSDDSSLDEAFAAARSDAERDVTAHQLDAFHRTFNFCMSCRQYTCANCWNEVEARCLSCAPMAAAESAPVFDTEVDPDRLLRFIGGPPATTPVQPTVDELFSAHIHTSPVGGDGLAPAAAATPPEGEPYPTFAPELEPADAAAHESEVGPEAPAEWATSAAPKPAPVIEVAATWHDAAGLLGLEAEAAPPDAAAAAGQVGAEVEPALGGLAPGQDIDDAIAAYEAAKASREVDAFFAGVEPEAAGEVGPGVAAEAVAAELELEMAEVVAEPPVAAVPEPQLELGPEVVPANQPEPVAAARVEAPEAEPVPALPVPAQPVAVQPVPETPRVDVVDQPVWPMVAKPAPEIPAEVQPAPPESPQAAPSWPTGPRWPTSFPARQALPPEPAAPGVDQLAALIARSSTDAMWAASSKDVLQPIAAAQSTAAVQPCTNCGISLSSTARFCRRCGTAQA